MKYVFVALLSLALFSCQVYATDTPGESAEREYVTDPALPTPTPGVIEVEKNSPKDKADGEETTEDFSVMEVVEEEGTGKKAWKAVKETSSELIHLIREALWSDGKEGEEATAKDTEEEVVSKNE
jgi:hypothetical protein